MSNKEKKFTKLNVVSRKSYFICQCGQSAKYPLCDGSHKNTSFSPEKFVSSANTSVSICGCNEFKTVVCECA